MKLDAEEKIVKEVIIILDGVKHVLNEGVNCQYCSLKQVCDRMDDGGYTLCTGLTGEYYTADIGGFKIV